jgi:hypothetical protein
MKSENSPEMDRFNAALKDVLSVSKSELKRLLAKDKKKSADTAKRESKSLNGASL